MAAFGGGGAAAAAAAPLFPMTPDQNVWVAASDGDLAKVQAYVQADPALLSKGDENGYSPIHAAAAYGHKELMQWLVGAGADVHARDSDGDTPLHHCDSPEAAEFLLSVLGASPTIANDQGRTAPMVHLADDEEDMVAFWRSKGLLSTAPIVTQVDDGAEIGGGGDDSEMAAEGP